MIQFIFKTIFRGFQAIIFGGLCLVIILSAWAGDVSMSPPVHALSLGDTPKYGPGFTHFNYTRPHAPKGGVLRLHSGSNFDNFNPFVAKGTPSPAFYLLDDSLCVRSLDEPSTYYGLIAEKMELAKDRSKIIFHIRPEARFHDHTPIRAEDVVFSFEALHANFGSMLRQYFRHITHVRELDPLRVEFGFSPNAPRETYLIAAILTVYPRHYWSKKDLSRTSLEAPVGSGPYRVGVFDPGKYIVYERVTDYWAKDLPVRRWQYNFDEIRYEYFRDTTVAMEAFRAGLFDVKKDLSFRQIKPLENLAGVKIIRLPHWEPQGMKGFFFNLRRKPFDDQKVRRALILAFDWEWTKARLLSPNTIRCDSFFTNSDLSAGQGHHLPVSAGSGFNRKNLLEASRMLDEAGWQLKNGIRVNRANTPLSFRLLTSSTDFQRLAQPWIFNLKKLGIHAGTHLVDSAQMVHRQRHYDYDMIATRYGQRIWPGRELILRFHSRYVPPGSGGWNLIGIDDPKIDRLVTSIVEVETRSELGAVCRTLDRLLMAGDYVIPLGVDATYNLAVREGIGIPDSPPVYGLGEHSWWVQSGFMKEKVP